MNEGPLLPQNTTQKLSVVQNTEACAFPPAARGQAIDSPHARVVVPGVLERVYTSSEGSLTVTKDVAFRPQLEVGQPLCE
jgi:hypothetical protein